MMEKHGGIPIHLETTMSCNHFFVPFIIKLNDFLCKQSNRSSIQEMMIHYIIYVTDHNLERVK